MWPRFFGSVLAVVGSVWWSVMCSGCELRWCVGVQRGGHDTLSYTSRTRPRSHTSDTKACIYKQAGMRDKNPPAYGFTSASVIISNKNAIQLLKKHHAEKAQKGMNARYSCRTSLSSCRTSVRARTRAHKHTHTRQQYGKVSHCKSAD